MNCLKDSADSKGFAVGRHLLADFKACSYDVLSSAAAVREAMLDAAISSGATLVSESFRMFAPHGVSGFIVISESHFSIHTWPEYSYAAVDIFTCGDTLDFDKAIAVLKERFHTDLVEITADLYRGSGGLNSPFSADHTRVQSLSWKNLFESANAWGLHVDIELDGIEHLDYDRLPAMMNEFARNMQLEVLEENPGVNQSSKQVCIYSQHFQGAHVALYHKKGDTLLYLELLTSFFVDPRRASEQAILASGAAGYRLRVSLRR